MGSENPRIASIRARLIESLENDLFYFRYDDEVEAKITLRQYRKCQSPFDVVDFVIEILKKGFPITEIELTNAVYMPGKGYVMKNPYGFDIYIKMRFDDFKRPEEIHIMSFHPKSD